MLVLAVLLVHAPLLSAEETIIVGEVVNETTGEPVPNVNIRFRGTKIGTSSDENGSYVLRVDMSGKAQLVFSAVGYFTQRFEIEPGTMAGLQVSMREKSSALAEVVISPGVNPALEILRQVRARRSVNDRTMHKEATAVVQREQQLFVSHIGKKQLRRALWRSLQAGMIVQEDSTYLLPLYRERQTFRLRGTEMIPANDRQVQALLLSPTDYSSLIGGEGNLNFYANSVSLMGHAFLSPLAASGNLYYRYYLEEPAEDAEPGTIVTIRFRTRNPFYATFNGEVRIDTTDYAVRSIHAYVPAEVAVNYVNNLHISQTLAPDGSIADEHLSVLLDFAIQGEQAGTIFPTLLLTTSLRGEQESGLPVRQDDSKDSLLATEQAFATLDSMPVMRVARWAATIITTGYIPTGTAVDIGHIEEILQVNRHEGVHVGLPFRTNERFSKVVSLEASVGYGIKDRLPKGMGRVSVNLPTSRKNTLQLEYQDRYIWSEVDDFDRLVRENSMGWKNFDFTSYAFEALHRDTLCANTSIRQRQLQLEWFADWSEHMETRAIVRAGWQPSVVSPLPSAVSSQPFDLTYQSLSLIGRFSWGERKYDGFFMRRYAYSTRYPVLYAGAEAGHWRSERTLSAGESDHGVYAHLRIMLTQHAQLGMGGTLRYALQAGALFGHVPGSMLWQADGNQGFAYDPYRFTFLHGGQMTADKYVTLHTEWNGQGVLFNLIPGIRWLHLRELVEAKVAYGYLSRQQAPVAQHAFYAEAGVGIGNILRVCDLYSIWSLAPQIQWGMRFRIHLGL